MKFWQRTKKSKKHKIVLSKAEMLETINRVIEQAIRDEIYRQTKRQLRGTLYELDNVTVDYKHAGTHIEEWPDIPETSGLTFTWV